MSADVVPIHPMRLLMDAVAPEHWEQAEILGILTNVGWQIAKDRRNRAAHGLSLRDGIAAIASPLSKRDIQYHPGEERERIIGPGISGRNLFVVVEWVDTGEELPALRIISVRYAEAQDTLTEDRPSRRKSVAKKPIDPENPPLAPGAKLEPWKDHFLRKAAEHKAQWDAKQKRAADGNEEAPQPPRRAAR